MKAPLNPRKGIPGRRGRKAPSPKLSAVGRVQANRPPYYLGAGRVSKKTAVGRRNRKDLAEVIRGNRKYNRHMGMRNRAGARSGEINRRLGPRR